MTNPRPFIENLDFHQISAHYAERLRVHSELRRLFDLRSAEEYAELALGIRQSAGNYSASEHGLGPRVLSRAEPRCVLQLAQDLMTNGDPHQVPKIVRDADIWCLKISVGSEMAAMLDPQRFWVTNVRTIWAHLLVKHNDNIRHANDELRAYRDDDYSAEMHYAVWCDIHLMLDTALTRLAEAGYEQARRQNVQGGDLPYLWGDAVANAMYEKRNG